MYGSRARRPSPPGRPWSGCRRADRSPDRSAGAGPSLLALLRSVWPLPRRRARGGARHQRGWILPVRDERPVGAVDARGLEHAPQLGHLGRGQPDLPAGREPGRDRVDRPRAGCAATSPRHRGGRRAVRDPRHARPGPARRGGCTRRRVRRPRRRTMRPSPPAGPPSPPGGWGAARCPRRARPRYLEPGERCRTHLGPSCPLSCAASRGARRRRWPMPLRRRPRPRRTR